MSRTILFLSEQSPMNLLLVLPPVAGVIVCHSTLVSAVVRPQVKVDTLLVDIDTSLVSETLPTELTLILLLVVFCMNSLDVVVDISDSNTTNGTRGLLLMDSGYVIL